MNRKIVESKVLETIDEVFVSRKATPRTFDVTKTLKANGATAPDMLFILLKLEFNFQKQMSDEGFKQLTDPDDPKLFFNRPVNDLVDYMLTLVKQ